MKPLSIRERQIASLLVEGKLEKEIGAQLGISRHTVRAYVRVIYRKSASHTRSDFVAWFVRGERQAATLEDLNDRVSKLEETVKQWTGGK